jgi:hypothetical protein
MGFSLTVALRRGQEVPDFGNDERWGGGQEFQSSNGGEVELAVFKTSVTAELYTHFPFINSLSLSLAPPAQSCRR